MCLKTRFSKPHPFSAFGFLASKEVKEAGVGNLGLLDRASSSHEASSTTHVVRSCSERLALRWVQKYIRAFGGNPDKVTMCVLTSMGCYIQIHDKMTVGENLLGLSRLDAK